MSTTIRPELSEKNPYHISRHRYYELKHFVMQYPEWVEKVKSIDSLVRATDNGGVQITTFSDPTLKAAEFREQYINNIKLVNQVVYDTDDETTHVLGQDVLDGIIFNLSYDKLRARYNIPYSRDQYYEAYRKFFWLLDRARN